MFLMLSTSITVNMQRSYSGYAGAGTKSHSTSLAFHSRRERYYQHEYSYSGIRGDKTLGSRSKGHGRVSHSAGWCPTLGRSLRSYSWARTRY